MPRDTGSGDNMPSQAAPNIQWLDWPAPKRVKACYTTRNGGVSLPPYDSFNLGDHVGDALDCVQANRDQLVELVAPAQLHWLKQVHGTEVVSPNAGLTQEADALITRESHQVCCIMTADCLPVFLCDAQATQVALLHAGWRGLLAGVIEQTLVGFQSDDVMAYLGPAISVAAFEVGGEVRQAFVDKNADYAQYFSPVSDTTADKWMADLYGIARSVLHSGSVSAVYGGDRCTYSEEDAFFSYRRDGVTGRMAHLIWLTS